MAATELDTVYLDLETVQPSVAAGPGGPCSPP